MSAPEAPGKDAFVDLAERIFISLAARVYLGRYDRLFAEHTVFSGVTYTDAHVTLLR